MYKRVRKNSFICLFIGMVLLGSFNSYGQDQNLSDSLAEVLNSGEYDNNEELSILKRLAHAETNLDKKIRYSLQLIASAERLDSALYIYEGYLRQGDAYRLKSDLSKAYESYFQALNVAQEHQLKSKEASINGSIADVYSLMGDSETAVQYYKKAISLLTLMGDSLSLASAQLNLGDEFYNQHLLDSALFYFYESGKIFEQKNYEIGLAYNLGNIGLVYAEKGLKDQAESNLNEAIEVLEKLEDYYPICVYLNAMSDIYESRGEESKSLNYATKSLELARKYGLKEQISDSYLKLSGYYEKRNFTSKALEYYKEHIVYRDQVTSIQQVQKMANLRTEYEVSQKQIEVDLLNQEKKIQRYVVIGIGIALLLIGLLAVSLFRRNKYMNRANKIIAHEKKRSDDLLKNILPEETAIELKESGAVKAKRFEEVTVLFTDFKGFTEQAKHLDPESLVESINFYFSKFDAIIEQYGLEKIKTIGDAYMCAGGLPFPSEDHALKVCQAALDMLAFVHKTKRNIDHKLAKFDIRIGINTGTVVAGVVGTKKFQYDIWGDAVNTASRMESSGEIGKVNIGETTYQRVKDYGVFNFSYRGTVEAKGKGGIAMYFIE